LKPIFFSSLFFILVIVGNAQKKDYISQSGIVMDIWKFHKPGPFSSKSGFSISSKIWYKDSFAIEELVSIKTDINTKNEETQQFIVDSFRFNDLRRKSIYVFHNFSDTAECHGQYSFEEADKKRVDGGWGFNLKREVKYSFILKDLTDTLIDNIFYKYMILFSEKKPKQYSLCFFRMDKEIYPFNYDCLLSQKANAPLVRFIDIDSALLNPIMELEVSFISNNLSEQEDKVINAWIQYAHANPVITSQIKEKNNRTACKRKRKHTE
jgi:hypothetical protein